MSGCYVISADGINWKVYATLPTLVFSQEWTGAGGN